MRKVNIVLLGFIVVLALSACSDNSTNPSKPNYFPLGAGSYWVYEQYGLDSLGNRDNSTKMNDSAIVIGTQTENVKTFSGVTTYKTLHNYSIGTTSEQKNYANEDAVYQYMDKIPGFGTDLFGMKLSDFIPVNWEKLIDFKNASWVILSGDTINIPEITLQGQKVKLTLIYTMNGSKGMTKSFTIGSQTVTAQDYTLTFNVIGTITLIDLGGLKLPINVVAIPTHMYLADGIGLVATKTETVKFSIANMINQTIEGSESNLLRYKIVK